MPSAVWPGIILSHWGRTDANHSSSTGYDSDDYSKPFMDEKSVRDWREVYSTPPHPCFDPEKVWKVNPM